MEKIKLKNIFATEESRFYLSCGFKFSIVYLFTAFFLHYLLWIIMSVNSIYFDTLDFGVSQELREAFIDSSLQTIYDRFFVLLIFLIVLFIAGVYLGRLLLRPFEIIGQYAHARTQGESVEYIPDTFSDYKFLTRFSEFFFRYLDTCEKNKQLVSNTIPGSFAKVRKPPFERVFFFHFILLIIILLIISGSLMMVIVSDIKAQMLEYAIVTFKSSKKISPEFFASQFYIFDNIVMMSIFSLTLSYLALSYHLYGKVSGAIHAFFLTMRAFVKGNFSARVHLVGYAEVRPYGRYLNKYLDRVERECEKNNNNVKS